MKKALLLHGWCGDNKNAWFPWMIKELESLGYEIIAPNLPHPDFPVLEEQINFLDDLGYKFSQSDLIIGHSLGCLLALHYMHKNSLSGLRALFVGPAYPGNPKKKGHPADGHLLKYRNEDIKLEKLGNNYTLFLSQDDPFIDLDSAEKYYRALENVEFVKYQDKGHFNTKAGLFEFQDLLKYIK